MNKPLTLLGLYLLALPFAATTEPDLLRAGAEGIAGLFGLAFVPWSIPAVIILTGRQVTPGRILVAAATEGLVAILIWLGHNPHALGG